MNEYNLELKWKWYVDLQSFPQNGFLSKLFAETPKPAESKLRKSLPFWDFTPLQCKLPSLGIKGMYYTRGKVGTTILNSSPDVDFITYDPYCYEHDSKKYDSLHDKHLGNYFKSKENCAFLRRIDILDDENYPKCSIADMNAYRVYLFRLHKDSVRREYNKAMELRSERNLWKTAHKNLVLNYFKELKLENHLRATCGKRKERARQQRLKELKPLQLLKNWDKRLKQIADRAKDEELRKEDIRDRETRRYRRVLERGLAIAMERPMKTLVKLRDQQVSFQEAERKKKEKNEFDAGVNAESYVFNKSLEQHNKLELYKQLVVLNDKGKEIARKKKDLEYARRKKKFEDELACRKMGKKPVVKREGAIDKEIKEQNNKLNKHERKVKQGLTHILQVLSILEKKEFGKVTEASKMIAPTAQENILIQIGHQMVRRTALLNLRFLLGHFASVILNYCISPSNDLSKLLPPLNTTPGQYFPTEKCLREAGLIPGPDEVTHGFVIEGQSLMEEVIQKVNTCGLKAYLVRKQQLLSTMVTNAKRLFDLIEDRVKLLKTIPDPYHNVPYLREEIMKNRKPISIDELTDKLITLLTIEDINRFECPMSGLGEIANLLAYARLASSYKIILNEGATCGEDNKMNITNPFDWDRIIEIHRLMKMAYDNIENEIHLDETTVNWVETDPDHTVAFTQSMEGNGEASSTMNQ